MTKQINTALAIKPVKTTRKQAKQAVVKLVYEHQQGEVINPPKPLPTLVISEKRAYQPTVIIGQSNDAKQLEQAKPAVVESKKTATKINQFGTSKGYGDRWPNDDTSAAAIWAALSEQGYNVMHVTKIWVEKLSSQNLQCDKGRVNDANLAIEINSYRKYLNHHGLMTAPKTEAA